MKIRLTISSLFAVLLSVCSMPGVSATPAASLRLSASDQAVLIARDGYRAGDTAKLKRAAQSAGVATHVLEPYVSYWQLRLRLEDRSADDVQAWLSRNQGALLAEQLRRDWLKVLGRKGEWALFRQQVPLLIGDDPEVNCYSLMERWQNKDESALSELKPLWLAPRELPDSCASIAKLLLQAVPQPGAASSVALGGMGSAQIWERFRILTEANLLPAARRVLDFLPRGEAPDSKQLDALFNIPVKFLERPAVDLQQRSQRELYILATSRVSRNDPALAASHWDSKLRAHFTAEDQAYVYGLIATSAARKLMPEAIGWFAEVTAIGGDAKLSDEQLAWRTRIALRQSNWSEVRVAIERMSASMRADPTWIYWLGRAFKAQGAEPLAQAQFARIAAQYHFYGRLAAEELGAAVQLPSRAAAPTAEEMTAVAENPSLQRSLALYRLDMRTEATREWIWAVRDMDDRTLLAAAELARRNEMWDRAINTADRTVAQHDFNARYLTPYREVLAGAAKARSLEEPLVLGLVRQESRFMSFAKSSVGASGLMQLMPKTAAWVARKIGLANFTQAKAHQPEVNAALGAFYLRQVLDELDGLPVVAAAAYNAGPGRARNWRDAKPLEGAIYAESIPFNETRDYVKKVMANTVYYAAVLGGETRTLKARLGIVATRPDSGKLVAMRQDPAP